ncbi:MAG: hypothetical protein A2Y91_05045 [Chloroflexi bacterium RBG_13_54_8]|nr:MAG: hypothetical protein A2Y91_05045 [Chloroflexi bacterium RBG_13_54_8]
MNNIWKRWRKGNTENRKELVGIKSSMFEVLERIVQKGHDLRHGTVLKKAVVKEDLERVHQRAGIGFWEGKTPCWEMCHCRASIRNECPAFKCQLLPCWTVRGTYCKLRDYDTEGEDISICRVCRVYRRWGADEPLEIKRHNETVAVADVLTKTAQGDRAGRNQQP